MGCSNTIPFFELRHTLPHIDNDTGDLMAEHQGRLGDTIPFHDIAATYSAGLNPH